jgi:hypothetical protein
LFNVKRTIFQLYLWEQVYKQTNSVGRKVTLGLDFGCMSRLSQERYWMLDSIGKFCFAPGHQHYLLKTFGFSTENDILHIRGIDLYPDRRESRVFDSSCTITWKTKNINTKTKDKNNPGIEIELSFWRCGDATSLKGASGNCAGWIKYATLPSVGI